MMTTLEPSKELGWEHRRDDKDNNDESMESIGYTNLARAIFAFTASVSVPHQRLPNDFAAIQKVPVPQKGSTTKSSGLDSFLIRYSASDSSCSQSSRFLFLPPPTSKSLSHSSDGFTGGFAKAKIDLHLFWIARG
jgi:hypothetical protein